MGSVTRLAALRPSLDLLPSPLAERPGLLVRDRDLNGDRFDRVIAVLAVLGTRRGHHKRVSKELDAADID